MSEKAGENLDKMCGGYALSPRALRWKFGFDLHDLSTMQDLRKYVMLETLQDYYFTVAFRFGSFVAISGHLSIVGRNLFTMPYDDYKTVINTLHFDLDQKLDLEDVKTKTPGFDRALALEGNRLPLLYIQMTKTEGIHEIFDKGIETEDNAFSIFFDDKAKYPFIQAASEPDMPGAFRIPLTTKIAWAPIILDGVFPKDEAQSDSFLRTIMKNPGYGLDFWELVRTVAKDHGAGFIPHPKTDLETFNERLRELGR